MASARSGFTLLELIVVLTVLAAVAALGIPVLSRLAQAVRITTAAHALTTSLATARMSAITLRTPVTVCPSRDARRCERNLVWENGWMVFIDRSRRGTPASPADVLQHSDPDLRGLALRSTVGRHYVRYQSDGFSSGSTATIRLCSREPALELMKVVVNNAGRVRSERLPPKTRCSYTP